MRAGTSVTSSSSTRPPKLWLRTKPFAAPPNQELTRCLRTFAHVVELLQLGLGAEVLDVGCGPGWLSEFLARCGYSVTGIDISPGHGRDRPASGWPRLARSARASKPRRSSTRLPVREMPWTSRFDAAILYDTMHHFDNELETLEVIRRTLVPGRRSSSSTKACSPPRGRPDEQSLIEEMQRYGTLESPFDPDYLEEVVVRAGLRPGPPPRRGRRARRPH